MSLYGLLLSYPDGTRNVYWRFFPLTLTDLVPEVRVGVFPQPAELSRLLRTLADNALLYELKHTITNAAEI